MNSGVNIILDEVWFLLQKFCTQKLGISIFVNIRYISTCLLLSMSGILEDRNKNLTCNRKVIYEP